jgi:ketosteroid isomerase-like protein
MSESIKKIFFSAILLAFSLNLKAQDNPETYIRNTLDKQAACWTAGDLGCFMENYWKSDSLKFVGKSGVTYGWQATYDRYVENYPDREAMGALTFTIIEAEQTGPETFFVLGKWHLKREESGDAGGHFTLLWKMIDGTWVIVTDHSS